MATASNYIVSFPSEGGQQYVYVYMENYSLDITGFTFGLVPSDWFSYEAVHYDHTRPEDGVTISLIVLEFTCPSNTADIQKSAILTLTSLFYAETVQITLHQDSAQDDLNSFASQDIYSSSDPEEPPTGGGDCALGFLSTIKFYSHGAAVDSVPITLPEQTCEWDAWTDVSWISVTSPSGTATGDGEVVYEIEENTVEGQARQGNVIVATEDSISTITVYQAGAPTTEPPEPPVIEWPPEVPGNVADGGVVICVKSDEWYGKVEIKEEGWSSVRRVFRNIWRKP